MPPKTYHSYSSFSMHDEAKENQIHRHILLLKIDDLRTLISKAKWSNTGLVQIQIIDRFIERIEAGEQPRKRSLTILNKWWRLYNKI